MPVALVKTDKANEMAGFRRLLCESFAEIYESGQRSSDLRLFRALEAAKSFTAPESVVGITEEDLLTYVASKIPKNDFEQINAYLAAVKYNRPALLEKFTLQMVDHHAFMTLPDIPVTGSLAHRSKPAIDFSKSIATVCPYEHLRPFITERSFKFAHGWLTMLRGFDDATRSAAELYMEGLILSAMKDERLSALLSDNDVEWMLQRYAYPNESSIDKNIEGLQQILVNERFRPVALEFFSKNLFEKANQYGDEAAKFLGRLPIKLIEDNLKSMNQDNSRVWHVLKACSLLSGDPKFKKIDLPGIVASHNQPGRQTVFVDLKNKNCETHEGKPIPNMAIRFRSKRIHIYIPGLFMPRDEGVRVNDIMNLPGKTRRVITQTIVNEVARVAGTKADNPPGEKIRKNAEVCLAGFCADFGVEPTNRAAARPGAGRVTNRSTRAPAFI